MRRTALHLVRAIGAMAFLVVARGPEAAEVETPKTLDGGWGVLGKELKGDSGFHEFSLFQRDERGKLKKVEVFLKIPEDVKLYFDRRAQLAQLNEGDEAYVFGRPVEHDVRGGGRGGGGGGGGLGGGQRRGGKDRQIQAAKAVLVGTGLKVNTKYKDPRDPNMKWCKGVLTQPGTKGLWMTYESGEYRVGVDRRTPVLKRESATDEIREKIKKKLLKKGAYLQVIGSKIDERPADVKKSDAENPAFVAETLVILYKASVKTVYPAVVKQ